METEVPSRVHAAVREHQLEAFLLLAFGWSWCVWLLGGTLGYSNARWLSVTYAWGPMIAAALVTELSGGDVLAWARQVVPKPGVGLRWYLLALTAPFMLVQTPELLAWIAGVPITLVEPHEVVVEFLFVLVLAGGLEEFGWRGFVQPRLQERRSALVAALAVGIVWALWHIPIVAGGGSGYQGGEWVGFLVFLPLMSIVLTWLYNSTRGGLLFVMIGHAVINATPVIEVADAIAGGATQLLALVGLPLAIVLYYGTPYLAANRPTPPIPGEAEASPQLYRTSEVLIR